MEAETTLKSLIQSIEPVSADEMERCQNRWDQIGKPLRSLGKFEQLWVKAAGMKRTCDVRLRKKAIVVMCSDHGIVEEGVSQCGSEVTAAVAKNMGKGTSSVCLMSRAANIHVFPYDVGMLREVPNVPVIKEAAGSRNMCKEPAMTRKQAVKTILTGIEIVRELSKEGYEVIGTGEMGIGNTSAAAAVCAALLNRDSDEIVGRGAGLSDDGLKKKRLAVKKALEVQKPDSKDPIDVLHKVGGFDLAALMGVFLGGAIYKTPIVIDGVITAAAALCAKRLAPDTADYMIASHEGREPACREVYQELLLSPVIYGDLALGEGTGAALLLTLMDSISEVYEQNRTFEQIQVEQYEYYGKGTASC